MNSFADLELHPTLLRAVEAAGYGEPTPIQMRAIPAALAGRDLIASANTGTGKTAAFVLPALQRLKTPRAENTWGPRILVLSPTRELASQILEAVRKYSKFDRVSTGVILGGMPYREQLRMLQRRVDLVVATPGRLIDHLERGRVDLSAVELLVLDEADRMLDMGFIDPVVQIAAACPESRQTLLFTATMDDAMSRLAGRLLRQPERIDVAGKSISHDAIDQRLLRADNLDHKHRLLDHLVSEDGAGKTIVFAATKRDADRLADELNAKGHSVGALHGDMKQAQRNRAIEALRRGRIRLLIATDVAARGIDVADITHVINFDLPKVAEDYVHRIGRTGRAGASGIAYSMYTGSDWKQVKAIERFIGRSLTAHIIPGLEPSDRPRRPRPQGFADKPRHAGRAHSERPHSERGQRDGGFAAPRRPRAPTGSRPFSSAS
ncbi:DEAD/DEAH box helicase [Arenibaculum sp.]|uniref:DEAD/DEAH box helicase n=1 Tax=Arenibaculum sp. TaxID=2865862 RepID=UPI002E160AE0|nr:DEAD/DEAH box helicase [Arenibaculum sp.]